MRLEERADQFEMLLYYLGIICVLLLGSVLYLIWKLNQNSIPRFIPSSGKSRKLENQSPKERESRRKGKDTDFGWEESRIDKFLTRSLDQKSQMTLGVEERRENSQEPQSKPFVQLKPRMRFQYFLSGKKTERWIRIGSLTGTIQTKSKVIREDHLSVRVSLPLEMVEDQGEKLVLDWEFHPEGDVISGVLGEKTWVYRKEGWKMEIPLLPSPSNDLRKEPSSDFLLEHKDSSIRLRLGSEFSSEEKFAAGYLEFLLFAQRAETEGKAGSGSICLTVMVTKIYPGFSTRPDEDGKFFMVAG